MTDDDLLDDYIAAHIDAEPSALHSLWRRTHLRHVYPRMCSGHTQGRLLAMLAAIAQPRRVIELGTFTGYSALSMAAGLDQGGVIDTCEIDDELQEMAASFFDRSPHGGKIVQHIGSALDIVPRLGGVYDLVFIDGDKREYPAYYDMLLDGGYVAGGSFILADNILWYGKVAEPAAHNDRHTQAIVEFNDKVARDPRVENIIVPIRDGINLIRVK